MAMMNGLIRRARVFQCAIMVWAFLALAPTASAAASVGEVTLSIGASQVEREGRNEPVAKGYGIVPGDVIRTTASGHVHIRFVDGALVSVRPDSVLHVVEYRYDPAEPSASLIKFHLEAGTVRGISGLAAQAARDKFRLNTPLVAIGIKGTDFVTQATAQSAVVLVNQGAIVLAPLDGACRADGFGPCGTAGSRELAGSMSGMALVYRQSTPEPVLQSVSSLKGAERILPKLPQERVDGSAAMTVAGEIASLERTTNTAVAESQNLERVATAAVVESRKLERFTSDAARERNNPGNPPAISVPPPEVVAPPVKDPGSAKEVLPSPSAMIWGRWAATAIPGDHLTVPFAEALSGNKVTIGDGYYVLFRNENIPNLLASASGVADFRLQSGVAHYRDAKNILSAGAIDHGSLSIDFSRRTFSTQIMVTVPGLGSEAVAGNGSIDARTGIFLGNSNATRVAGAVSLDTAQAGYLFTKAVGNGALSGATLWGR